MKSKKIKLEIISNDPKDFFKYIPSVGDFLSGNFDKTPKPLFETYLMVDKGSGFYKIGKTTDVLRRYNQLKNMCPKIEFIGSCNLDIEKKLHDKFKTKRKMGEWFKLSEIDVQYIQNEFKIKKDQMIKS